MANFLYLNSTALDTRYCANARTGNNNIIIITVIYHTTATIGRENDMIIAKSMIEATSFLK